MNIKELKEAIESLPDNMEVILQKDAEGNGYSPLEGFDPDCVYIPETTWSGEIYDTNWSAGDSLMDEEEWEKMKSKPKCLLLFPVN